MNVDFASLSCACRYPLGELKDWNNKWRINCSRTFIDLQADACPSLKSQNM